MVGIHPAHELLEEIPPVWNDEKLKMAVKTIKGSKTPVMMNLKKCLFPS